MTTYDPFSETAASTRPQRQPVWRSILFAIPVIGWLLSDLDRDPSSIGWAVLAFVAFWGCSTMLFGYAGLILPALFLVALMFVVLILISRG